MGKEDIDKLFDLTPILRAKYKIKEAMEVDSPENKEFMEEACDTWKKSETVDFAYDSWKDDKGEK